ncbi:retinol dehydrogenase 13 [Echinops telfairi]|uniref:Retinol dehydrogenase 13 n=1 Tax=Echinops telfairi TaxID=9371 RepID=A0AC55D9B3_ECHTE|nr:retinol dehydrogenase 13 [Echinops telfairi]
MSRYLLPLSVAGTAVGGAVLLKDHVGGGACPSKATIPGKTVIITGANTGIGKQTALELARRGGNVILACRDMEKCEAAAKDIRGETLNHRVNARHLDLSSLRSIRDFAKKIIQEEERVDVLVNNAAVMRCPHWTTEDGFEMQFGVNHLDLKGCCVPEPLVGIQWCGFGGRGQVWHRAQTSRALRSSGRVLGSAGPVVCPPLSDPCLSAGTGVTANALHPGVARTELGRHTAMHSSTFSSFTLGECHPPMSSQPRPGPSFRPPAPPRGFTTAPCAESPGVPLVRLEI